MKKKAKPSATDRHREEQIAVPRAWLEELRALVQDCERFARETGKLYSMDGASPSYEQFSNIVALRSRLHLTEGRLDTVIAWPNLPGPIPDTEQD